MIEEQKLKKWIMLAVGGVILFIIVAMVISAFTQKKEPKESMASAEVSPVIQEDGTAELKPASSRVGTTSKDLVQVIDKESILMSTDSGETFASNFKIATTTTKNAFANVITINFHPLKKDHMIVTSYEDGLFSKTPEKDAWDIIEFPPQQIYSFILDKSDPEKKMFASGVVDNNGRVFRTIDGGETWKAVYVEPGSGTTITALSQDPRNTKTIYSGTSRGTIVKSVDGGSTWRNIGSKIDGIIRYISFDATRANVLYLLSLRQKMYYSSDKGATWIDWEKKKAEEVAELNAQANILAKEKNTEGAKALREQASALNLRNAKNKAPSGINLIVIDPRIAGTIYAGTGNGLFKSTDSGKYWTELDIIESAHGHSIQSIAINPKNPNEVVFVAGTAFYKTQNGGQTWSITPLSSDRPASFVAYDPYNVNTVYIGVSSI